MKKRVKKNNLINGLKKGLKDFAGLIAVIVNTFLLLVVYLIGVGATTIVAKLTGKHFLQKKLDKKTYWTDLNLKKEKMEEYYRQF